MRVTGRGEVFRELGVGWGAGAARSGLLVCALSVGLVACAGKEEPGTTARERSPEELAARLHELATPAGLTTTAATALTEAPVAGVAPLVEAPVDGTENGRPVRSTVTLTRYAASAVYDTQVLLNPASDVIYPGSVLIGSSVADGSYREVVRGVKNDITVSYGGLNGVSGREGTPGIVSGKIRPTLSGFRTFHNYVMGQTLNGASSIYTLQATDATTSDSFDVHFAAGVSYRAPAISASIKGNFDYSKATVRNRYVMRFAQTFYTVDVDQGGNRFLYGDFDIADFEGNRPVYVASVACGRLAFITLESTESKETIAAGLSAILAAPQLAVDASANTSVKAVQDASNLNITVIGSDRVVTTLAGFKDFLEGGGFSSANTGQIVSYKLRFVDDNSVANVVFAGEYMLRSASRTTGAWDVTVQADGILFAGTDGSRRADMVDLMGSLVLGSGSETYTLWQRPRSNLGLYPDDATEYADLTAETTPVRFSASTLEDALRFRTVDVYDFNLSSKDVPFGPADETFTIERARRDGGHLVVTANRADGEKNAYVKFRVKVDATPAF